MSYHYELSSNVKQKISDMLLQTVCKSYISTEKLAKVYTSKFLKIFTRTFLTIVYEENPVENGSNIYILPEEMYQEHLY